MLSESPRVRYWVCMAAVMLGASGQARADGYQNVLLGKTPVRASGVSRAEALVDGVAARDGGGWKTKLTCVFDDASAVVEFDLGNAQAIHGAWLSGDNNDDYRVELSLDGRTFTKLWDARATPHAGLQARSTRTLDKTGRYVRVRALRGDGRFAISELQLFSGQGAALPVPARAGALAFDERLRDRTLLFGLALFVALLVPSRPRAWLALVALGVAAAGVWQLVRGILNAWPVEADEVSLIRGTIACLGAAAVAREAFAPRRWPANRAAVGGVLGLCAVIACLAFYDFGHAQFYNAHSGRTSFAHYADLRQYYPTAKYFRELSYFRMYDADLATYAEQRPQGLNGLEQLPVRDLQNFRTVPVSTRAREIAEAKQHFSPARWAEYRRDSNWFRSVMGDTAYLETLTDYGGNATPTWIAIAHALFFLPPSDTAFTLFGLIDPALMLITFLCILRAFGWRTMLVSALVFGANDFVMYGTNWGGATLRHDWLAYLGLGACALRRERWVLGGALFGLATMIRAFPALALLGAALPAIWHVVEQAFRTRRLPSPRALWDTERATLSIAVGAAGTMAVAGLLPMLVLGADAWPEWLDKVAKIESDPHPACVALRNLIAGTADQARILHARWPLHAALIAFYTGAVAIVGRHARPEQAAVLGLCLVPVWLYPANYYLHFVFLLPLLADERPARAGEPALSARDALLWMIALGMCGAQYFTTLTSDLPLHFYLSTVTLFFALTALSCVMLARDPSVRRWFAA